MVVLGQRLVGVEEQAVGDLLLQLARLQAEPLHRKQSDVMPKNSGHSSGLIGGIGLV